MAIVKSVIWKITAVELHNDQAIKIDVSSYERKLGFEPVNAHICLNNLIKH